MCHKYNCADTYSRTAMLMGHRNAYAATATAGAGAADIVDGLKSEDKIHQQQQQQRAHTKKHTKCL